ncbi:MAG TPA: peptidoglycan-binding domain-containing protein [Stellaceae bacterium]|nr:peptidoglycan-binding domain-containing protein [Stellaceae bacterium]
MKKLILATASVLALGLAGAGAGYAQTTSPSTTPPSSTTGSSTATMPQQTQNETTPGTLSEEQIKDVQQKLKSAGLYNGPIDGQMGPQTKEAITNFQKQKGLEQTGNVDQQTMAALNQMSSSPAATSGTSTEQHEQNEPNQK